MEITQEMASNVLAVVDQGLIAGLGIREPGHFCVLAATSYALGERHGDSPMPVSRVLRIFDINFNDARWTSNAARAKAMRRLGIAQLGTAGTLDERLFIEKLTAVSLTKLLPRILRSAAELQEEPNKAELLEAASRCQTEGMAAVSWLTAAAARWTNGPAVLWFEPTLARWADAIAAIDVAAARRRQADTAIQFAADAATATARWSAVASGPVSRKAAAANAAEASTRPAATAARWAKAAASWAASVDQNAASGAGDEALSWFAEEVVEILVEMKTPGSNFLFLTE